LFCWQQLAALLIARQVIGNVKESALPYLLEQLRLAKMSFDLFGALSPSEAKREPPGSDTNDQNKSTNRNVSQAELESSLFKVDNGLRFVSFVKDLIFKFIHH
jgi:anoctamin-8